MVRHGPSTLIWMDMEMTGLDPEENTIIEIATIVTNNQLEIIAEGPDLVIHQDLEILQKMDNWNTNQHTKSGLWNKVLESKITLQQAEEMTLDFISQNVSKNKGILAGNSIWQDRRFLIKYMKNIHNFLHYRMLDVSSIKILAKQWNPQISYTKKEQSHRALSDIRESIRELAYYKEHFFRSTI